MTWNNIIISKVRNMFGLEKLKRENEIRNNCDARYAMSLTKYHGIYDSEQVYNLLIQDIKDSISQKCSMNQYHLAYSINKKNQQFESRLVELFKSKGYSVTIIDSNQGIVGRCILLSWDIDF